jgi:geranylgeranylglycerol-phosphate geranylgeranyltransferase
MPVLPSGTVPDAERGIVSRDIILVIMDIIHDPEWFKKFGNVLTFAALAFFFDLGGEIAADAMDVKGDQVRSSKSLAKRWGRTRAMRIAGLMFVVFFVLTLLPFLMGWLGYDYLFLIAVTDLFMISCSLTLVRSRVIEEGRVQIRRLYLAWGIFVIVFAITRIL